MLTVVAVVFGAYVLGVFGGGVLVQALCRWLVNAKGGDELRKWVNAGLPSAGRLIGWLERFLVISFVLMGQPGAVAVVLAAKGLLRFAEVSGRGDEPERRVAEYVIVGTLFSFSLAVAVGAVARCILQTWVW